MCVVHDDVVGDVGVDCCRLRHGRRVDVNSSEVLHDVVVGNGEQTRVLHLQLHDRWRAQVVDAVTGTLDAAALDDERRVEFAHVRELDCAVLVACECRIFDALAESRS